MSGCSVEKYYSRTSDETPQPNIIKKTEIFVCPDFLDTDCRAAAVMKKTLVRLKKVESFALISKAIIPTKITFAL